jgi:hypothetical protein
MLERCSEHIDTRISRSDPRMKAQRTSSQSSRVSEKLYVRRQTHSEHEKCMGNHKLREDSYYMHYSL